MSVSDQLQPLVFAPFTYGGNARSVVIINGTRYAPLRWEIHMNGHGATDDGSVTLPIKGNPDFSVQLFQTGYQALQSVPIEIWAGFIASPHQISLDTSGMTRRFIGQLDLYSATPDGMGEVTFNFRSLAIALTDTKLTSAPLNMTSVQFIEAIAAYYGLKTNILLDSGVTPITLQEMLGRELVTASAYNGVVYNSYPWDLALQCALFDDVDVWVSASTGTLNYASPTLINRSKVSLPYGSLLIDPRMSHSVRFNKGIRVELRTWSQKTRTSFTIRAQGDPINGITISSNTRVVTQAPNFGTQTTTSTTTSPTGQSSTTSTTAGGNFNTSSGGLAEPNLLIYKFFKKNITPQAATNFVMSTWRQYSAQEYALEFAFQMTPQLLPSVAIESLFAISGLPYANFNRAGTINDGYYPRKMTETFDMHGVGWNVSVSAINLILPSGAV